MNIHFQLNIFPGCILFQFWYLQAFFCLKYKTSSFEKILNALHHMEPDLVCYAHLVTTWAESKRWTVTCCAVCSVCSDHCTVCKRSKYVAAFEACDSEHGGIFLLKLWGLGSGQEQSYGQRLVIIRHGWKLEPICIEEGKRLEKCTW